MPLTSLAGLGTGLIIPSLSPENCGNPINLFLLPEHDLQPGKNFLNVTGGSSNVSNCFRFSF